MTLGRLVYTAFETQWVTKLGDDPTPRVPQHRFFLVRMSIVNGAGEEMLTPNVFLEDDKGNSYPEVSDGTGVPQWIGYLRHIKPAESAQGNMVFDVPPAHYKLRVFDAQGEQAALIDIPLSFGSETPDVAVPEQLRRQQ